ncbi:MAG: RidA family protein [Blastocatellia bacterium]|nr:RidA family protein [Blastocatellia bacterium]MBL8196468.1 RidA family protein [Blastocatellia bacterium]
MQKEAVKTDNAPQAIGPYSQAIKLGDLVFLSGQVHLDPATGQLVEGDITNQTQRVMENLQAVLLAAGSSFEKVVKTTIYLADMDDFAKVNEVYGRYFPSPQPARSTVAVARLPRDARIEIDLIAYV